jgi:SAM-dependent methyltransferase
VAKVVLLFRSGRHLGSAVTALRTAFPAARLVVIAQPGSERELQQAGVPERDWIAYTAGRFALVRFLVSSAFWQALALRPWRVALLWNDPHGWGLSNVTRTSMLAGLGRRPIAVTPDGALHRFRWSSSLRERLSVKIAVLASRWDVLRTRVEGPELEPPIWHSHYLACAPSETAMSELARPLRGRVVDIGAGTGYAARFLDASATDYLPTDLPGGRDGADATISRQGTRPRVYCAGAALPFPDASIDGVISSSVLEHVVDVNGILRDAFRVLRPGGRVLITTPFFFPFHGEPDDYRRWTVHGLAAELRQCGFEIEETRRLGSSMSTLVLNLHLVVKYEWRTASSPMLRFVSRWAWPLVLPWQAATNLLATALHRYEPESRMPLGVAIVARRPMQAAS